MLKTKRLVKPNRDYEPWLDWHIRSFRKAGQAVRDFDISVKDKLERLKRTWAGHIVRFGTPKGGVPSEPRMLKALFFWRPLAWWRYQQGFNDINWDPIRHPPKVGRPKRWEEQFSSNWPQVLA